MNATPNAETIERIKGVILEAVKRHAGTASFVDLEKAMAAAGIEYQGEYLIPAHKKVVLWSDWTQEACEAVLELRANNEIHYTPTSFLTYLADGKAMNLPIPTELPGEDEPDFEEHHWVPLVIQFGPYPEEGDD